MPRNIDSYIIRRFIDHCESGLITAQENTSGEAALESVLNAFRGILEGYPPDETLHINKVGSGPKSDPKMVQLAWAVYRVRLANDPRVEQLKWSVIARSAARFLLSEGRNAPTERSTEAEWDSFEVQMKRLLRRWAPDIDDWLHNNRGIGLMQQYGREPNGGRGVLASRGLDIRAKFDREYPDSWYIENFVIKGANPLLLLEK